MAATKRLEAPRLTGSCHDLASVVMMMVMVMMMMVVVGMMLIMMTTTVMVRRMMMVVMVTTHPGQEIAHVQGRLLLPLNLFSS